MQCSRIQSVSVRKSEESCFKTHLNLQKNDASIYLIGFTWGGYGLGVFIMFIVAGTPAWYNKMTLKKLCIYYLIQKYLIATSRQITSLLWGNGWRSFNRSGRPGNIKRWEQLNWGAWNLDKAENKNCICGSWVFMFKVPTARWKIKIKSYVW